MDRNFIFFSGVAITLLLLGVIDFGYCYAMYALWCDVHPAATIIGVLITIVPMTWLNAIIGTAGVMVSATISDRV